MAGGAGAGAAAIGIDAGDQVLDRAFHHRPADRAPPRLLFAVGLDEGDLGHCLLTGSRHLFHGDGSIGQSFRRDAMAPSAISFLPTIYSGAALTASTAATAPSRRWKTANLRAAGSPRSTSPVGRAAPAPRSAASGHTGRTRTTALRYRSWACPPSPATACLAWSMAFCTHSSRISMPSRPIWRVQSPAAKIAGSPVLRIAGRRRCRPAGKAGSASPTHHWERRRCRPARCRRDRSCRRPVPPRPCRCLRRLRRRCCRLNFTPAFAMFGRIEIRHGLAKRRAPSAGPRLRTPSRPSPRLAPTAATSSPI